MMFVVGLFILQIAFAFKIHGDIGPQMPVVPGVARNASPVLVGRIDSLVNRLTVTRPVHPSPEGAMAPAVREDVFPGMIRADVLTGENQGTSPLNDSGERFLEYTITPGDTLERISRKLYGSTGMVPSLIRINRITNDRALRAGNTLKVPRTGLLAQIASKKQ